MTHPAAALAQPEQPASLQSVEGLVLSSEARWNARQDRIVTRSVIRTADGRTVEVSQPGGTVDGIAMRQYPSPPALRPGDQVTMQARVTTTDRAWRVHEVTSLVRPGPEALFHRDAQESSPQLGFVRTTTDLGAPLYWASGCVFLTYDRAGTTHLPGDEEFAVMDQVLANWRQGVQSCSYMRFVLEGRDDVEVGFDTRNVIKFREERWCRPSAQDEDAEECYDPRAAGLTTLFFVNDPNSARNGEILDADIELNAVHFAISSEGRSLGGLACLSDLANTLTHEVGHLLGLDHTCRLGNEPARLDNQGNLVPQCSSDLPGELLEATMHPSQECGETKKITLEADDIDAICSVYAMVQDPRTCERVSLARRRGFCSVGPAPGRSDDLLSLLWPLAAAGLLLFRRRRAGA